MLSNQQTANSGVVDEAKREEFAQQWAQVRPQVVALCRRSFREAADSEDLVGQVALRAARAYGSFRGDSSFATWVIAIARREIARAYAREDMRKSREVSLEQVTETAPESLPSHTDTAVKTPTKPSSLKTVVQRAVVAKELSQAEAEVILARMAQPTLSWEELGLKLNMDGTTCAVAHCRAIPKLRVFLFMRHPNFLGGADAIEEAFEAAQSDSKEPLSQIEAATFKSVILERSSAFRKPGWRLALRSACGKIVKKLPLP